MFSNPPDIPPKVFLGYTVRSNDLITAIEENFKEEEFPIQLHPVDLMDISQRSVERFSEEIKSCDFAIFVFSSNWGLNLNGRTTEFAQHIAFQLGMCMESLGKERVFYALPQGFEDPFLESFVNVTSSPYKETGVEMKRALKTFCNKSLNRISKLGAIERTGFKEDNDEFMDLDTHYCLRIINEEGDAFIERQMTIVANQDNVSAREHQIFSDDSPANYDQCCIEAWDQEEKNMYVEEVYNSLQRKEFRVNFRHPLNQGDRLTYTYKFFWPKMFPPESSNFLLKSTAKKLFLDLEIPDSWDLMNTKAVGKKLVGSTKENRIAIKELGAKNKKGRIRHSFELKGFGKNILEIRFRWKWEKNKGLD